MALPYLVKNAGDTGLVVEFSELVSREVNEVVIHVADHFRLQKVSGVIEVVPTFRSLLIVYEPLHVTVAELRFQVDTALRAQAHAARIPRVWRIPVCYDATLAADSVALMSATGLSHNQIIEAHSGAEQHVYMIGFLPGQPYIGDLPACFDLPRLKTPRTNVPAGSVGVVGRLTCIYPLETPCGWHLVGRVPQSLPSGDASIRAGDRIRFQPISLREFDRIVGSGDADLNTVLEMV